MIRKLRGETEKGSSVGTGFSESIKGGKLMLLPPLQLTTTATANYFHNSIMTASYSWAQRQLYKQNRDGQRARRDGVGREREKR